MVLPSAEGGLVTPSVVWCGCDPPAVGESAKAEQRAGASDVAAFFKRGMGEPHLSWYLGGRDYSPIDLSALVLQKIKADAEAHLKARVTEAVITVPAYFDNRRREATIEAGTRAGLKVLRIINEPTAAALAYGVHKTDANETVLVYDLGGGTFDVTLVKITPTTLDVLATDGDHELGGKDWDDRVAQCVAGRFRDEHGIDPLEDAAGINEVLTRCEDAKRRLSGVSSVKVSLECGGIKASYDLTRAKFEELTVDLMERTQRLTEQVLRDAGVAWTDLAGVLPVGGSTQMPMVHEYVRRMSGKPPRTGVPVEQAVALGAAVQAAMERQAQQPTRKLRIAGEKKVTDVMGHSLGMIARSPDGMRYINSILIKKNQPIPAAENLPYKLRTRPGANNVCDVYLTQGETTDPTKCSHIGKYTIAGIDHDAKTREAILDIKYAYDANGSVKVSATRHGTGAALPVTRDDVPADMSWVGRPPVEEPWVPEPVTIYLLIDVSGSMSGPPLVEAQRAAGAFRQKCDLSHMSIGLVSFGSDARTELRACQDTRDIDRAVQGLSITGSTNMAAGLRECRGHLSSSQGTKFIVLLTDGYPDDQSAAVSEGQACRAQGIEVIAIGTGAANVSLLSQISSSQENAVFASAGNVVGTFSTIAQAITENSGDGQLRLKKR